jgi:ATP-dependent DNA helicase RecG
VLGLKLGIAIKMMNGNSMTTNTKHWMMRAVQLLDSSFKPIAQELNELDWKSSLSTHRDRLTEHLIAFSNYSGGGFLVYGIEDPTAKLIGVSLADVGSIVNTICQSRKRCN